MNRERVGQLLFLAATAFALAFYALTACSGFPWGESTHEALGWSGVLSLPCLPHPVWGYFVRVFAGHYIALSCVSAALAAGLLASAVNRHFGWRTAVGVAVVWTFWSTVWNCAVTGERQAFGLMVVVLVVWLAHVGVLWGVGRMRRRLSPPSAGKVSAASSFHVLEKFGRWNALASWLFLAAAGVFALASLSFHDYRLGEASSVYAHDIVAEAGGRWIVLNGVADDQIAVLRAGENLIEPYDLSDHYRTQFVARVKAEWPGSADYVAAAQMGPAVFVDLVRKGKSDRLYFMNGKSTTVSGWKRRWQNLVPYLASEDAAIPALRRAFAFEGNALANALQDTGTADAAKSAWQMYWQIFDDIDRGNFSALVNLSEMVRRGHLASAADRERIRCALDDFFKDKRRRENAPLVARMSGPIRADEKQIAKMRTEAAKRLAERKAAGEAIPLSKEMQALVDANGDMIRAMDSGDFARAGGLARRILLRPEWRGFVPANAVLGSITASEGDYASSERFFRTALAGGGDIAPVTYNDFADALMHLGKCAEAEQYARKAVAAGEDGFWLAKMTLAESLVAQKKNPDEVRELLRDVSRCCPVPVRAKVRELKRKAAE